MKKLFIFTIVLLFSVSAHAQTRLDGFSNDTSVGGDDEFIFWNTGAGAVRNILVGPLTTSLQGTFAVVTGDTYSGTHDFSSATVDFQSSNTELLYDNSGSVDGISTSSWDGVQLSLTGSLNITGTIAATSDLFLGGTTTSDSEIYSKVTSSVFVAEGGFELGNGTDQNETIIVVNRASTDPTISWDETNEEFDFNYPINAGGTGNKITFGNTESIENVTDDIILIQGSLGTDDTDISFDLDGTRPVMYSATDTAVEVNDTFYVTNGSTTGQLAAHQHFSFSLESPANADNFFLLKAPYDMTIVSITGILDPIDTGENLNINIRECDSTGDSCVTITGTMNVDNDGTTDSSHTNATIDSGDWIDVYMNTIGSTLPDNLAATVIYTID